MKRLLIAIACCLLSAAPCTAFAQSVEATPPGAEQQRYKKNPSYLLFENYVLDVVGELPDGKSRALQAMNLQKVFKTRASEWHEVLREALHLSATLDIAILDLWYKNQDIAKAKGVTYPAPQFAMNFTDEYMKAGSQIDVWPPGALEAAKARIAQHKSPNAGR